MLQHVVRGRLPDLTCCNVLQHVYMCCSCCAASRGTIGCGSAHRQRSQQRQQLRIVERCGLILRPREHMQLHSARCGWHTSKRIRICVQAYSHSAVRNAESTLAEFAATGGVHRSAEYRCIATAGIGCIATAGIGCTAPARHRHRHRHRPGTGTGTGTGPALAPALARYGTRRYHSEQHWSSGTSAVAWQRMVKTLPLAGGFACAQQRYSRQLPMWLECSPRGRCAIRCAGIGGMTERGGTRRCGTHDTLNSRCTVSYCGTS